MSFPPYPYQSFLPWRGRARVRLRVKPEGETVPVSGRAAATVSVILCDDH